MLPKELIYTEIDFAERAAELEPTSLENALYKYTNLYGALFVPSPTRDPQHEAWLSYLSSIDDQDIKDSTYNYYVESIRQRGGQAETIYSGKPCFIYHTEDDQVHLHFNNNEGSEPGPLSADRIPNRLAELKSLFLDIYKNHPEAKYVNGYSWLYNLPAYTRLFPPEFIKSAVPVYADFTKLNIWGQFLNSSEHIKPEVAREFKAKVRNAKTYEELIKSFPFYQLKVHAPIEIFYRFYKVEE